MVSLFIILVAALLLWSNNRVNSDGRTVLKTIADAINGATVGKSAGNVAPVTIPYQPQPYTGPSWLDGYHDRQITPLPDPRIPVSYNTLYGVA